LLQYGHSDTSYATLQEGLEYFFANPGSGYVAFKCVGFPFGMKIVLGDPVADQPGLPDLLSAFHGLRDGAPAICYLQCHAATATLLHDRYGFYANQLGVETSIDPQKFSLAGNRMADLRHFANICSRAGVEALEVTGQAEQYFPAMRAISQQWISSKTVKAEMSLLARRMVLAREMDVRYFVALRRGEPIAFVIYDPLYDQGSIIGYQAAILRARPDSPKGTLDCINLAMIASLKEEQKNRFSLGLTPMAMRGCANDMASVAGRALLAKTGDTCNDLYEFKGLDFHKRRYRGEETPVFVCSRHQDLLLDLLATFLAVGVISRHNSALLKPRNILALLNLLRP
jgi:lysylphosphatidylglycerol synthetase-like protein (DUF2156 family)